MAANKVTDIRGTRVMTGLVPALYDRVLVTYPDSVTQVYTFYYDGNVIGVVTVVVNGTGDLVSAERTT